MAGRKKGFSWGFRKSKKVLPGLRLTATNKGVSARIGTKHVGTSVGKRGTKTTISFFGFRLRF
jgi:hypothetical protein